jgi:hypothetical protein
MWKHLDLEDDRTAKLLRDTCVDLRRWKEPEDDVQIQACKNIKLAIQALALGEQRKLFQPLEWDSPQDQTNQILRQCWFAGNHADVGGGNEDMTHANITLAWMISQLMDTIQFNAGNLWAITTTRSWSKPSPSNDLIVGSGPYSRSCRVVARAPISSTLRMYRKCGLFEFMLTSAVRSETSMLAYLMRVFGNQSRHPLRSEISWLGSLMRRMFGSLPDHPKQVYCHHSVYILRSLGIAKYTKLSPPNRDEQNSSKAALLSNP